LRTFGEVTKPTEETPFNTSSTPRSSRNGRCVVEAENSDFTGVSTVRAPARSPVSSGAGVPHRTSTYFSGFAPGEGSLTVSTW